MKVRFNSTQGFILALLIHVLVVGLLVMSSFDTEKSIKPESVETEPQVMNAIVIDQGKIKAEAKRLEEAEKKKQDDQTKRKQEAIDTERKRKAEEKKLAELKQQQKELEQKRQQEEKAHKAAEQERVQQEKLHLEEEQKKQADELVKLEAEKHQKEQEQKKLKEEQLKKEALIQAEAEKKRLEEEAHQKAEADKKAKAEADAKRRADEDQKRRNAEMAVEEAARAKEVAGGFYGKIASQVKRNFNIRGFKSGLKCVLEIRMVPGGDVISVNVIESSGDSRFDRAAEIAAQKASPLPVPDDKKIFDQYFRTVRFRFNPG